MDDYMPQDEYFEWEDIIPYRSSLDLIAKNREESHQTQPLEYRSTFTFEDCESSDSDDFQWSEADTETAASTTSIQTTFTFQSFIDSGKEDLSIDFPSYEEPECDPREGIDIGLGGLETAIPIVEDHHTPEVPVTTALQSERINPRVPSFKRATITGTRDCEALEVQPCGNVNYLLHQWREEDVSASWKHVVSKSKSWNEDVSSLDSSKWKRHNIVRRLENSSWRTWSKLRFGLRTVHPKTINWLKDCDNTCLYGPFAIGSRTGSSSPMTRDVRTPNSKSNSSTTTPKSILKKPSTAEILCRGSLPSYSISSSTRVSIQVRSLSDNSPLTHVQLDPKHVDFRTPKSSVSTSLSNALQSKQVRRTVQFLPEVRQYVIVIPIGDRKIHRTVKKTKSATLKEENAPFKLVKPAKAQLVSEPSYWRPESLWSQNPKSVQNQGKSGSCEKKDDEWTWLGVVGEEAVDDEPSIKEGSLSYYYGNQRSHSLSRNQNIIGSAPSLSSTPPLHFDTDIVDDPIDCLLSATSSSSVGSLSPPSSAEEDGSSISEDSSDDDLPGVASPPIVRAEIVRDEKFGSGMRGLSLDIGIMDDEKHRLYKQVMEEFNLEY
ncbi:uncharacterized protein RCO7_05959 [Rhynchosporium graminicola]|uniref:Nitrogen regulatory protein areA GATA-like domain-containing protein n=1 Tax=Rhynchosporium graminicola TaxID=2792576 RepID=A0A1E1KX83_9HELO|nr:uncharacterized protein RCO7_05959 [Rhynchosporium commune]